jgi:hypothetical protein
MISQNTTSNCLILSYKNRTNDNDGSSMSMYIHHQHNRQP